MTVLCLYCCKRASDSGILFSNDFFKQSVFNYKKKKKKKFALKQFSSNTPNLLVTSSFSDARHINTTAFHVVTLRCACLHVHTIFSLINHFLKHSVLFRKPVYKYTYKNVSYRKKDKNLSVISYLQNISPPLLIKNIILEVFPVDLLRLLNLLWSHYFSWRAGSRWGIKEEAGDSTDKEVGETNTAALVCFSTVHHDNQV